MSLQAAYTTNNRTITNKVSANVGYNAAANDGFSEISSIGGYASMRTINVTIALIAIDENSLMYPKKYATTTSITNSIKQNSKTPSSIYLSLYCGFTPTKV